MLLEEINTASLIRIDWSLILSVFALILSMITYFVHDRKLKRQERLINDYQLEKISLEQKENSKAIVKANVVKLDRGKRIVKIFNAGKAIAKNVNVEFLSGLDGININDDGLFPYEFLNPQEGTEFFVFLFEGPNSIVKIRMTWDDDFALQNKYDQILTL